MLRSRTLRIAVNLCLTASLLTPVTAQEWLHPMPCEVTASGASVCAGCAHCEVDTAGGYCGCCKKAAPAHPAESHCCGGNADDGRLSTVERLCAEQLPIKASEPTDERASLAVCLCSAPAEPKAPATPRPPIEQLLQQIIAGVFIALGDATSDDPLLVAAPPDGSGFALSTSRDSQRRLCVWRI